jgi:spermidine synthase
MSVVASPASAITIGSARSSASLLLMAASGFAGLGYQIVWTQQCALWLGHEAAAMLAVVAAFFGGLAVGALALGPRIERSTHPVRWYAGCELAIALWGVALAVVMAPFSMFALRLMGTQPGAAWQWTVAFVGTFVLLLPATAAMGATLPAMERITLQMRDPERRSIAPLYASNTFGAVIGVLVIAFWLAPTLGFARTAAVCVILNLACGLAAFALFRSVGSRAIGVAREVAGPQGVLWSLATTGFLGIGYEVLVVRVLSQVEEDTVYTFAMLLAVYLIGSALGAAAYHRWLTSHLDQEKQDEYLPCVLAAACLASIGSLWGAEHIRAFALESLGSSLGAALAAEAVVAVVAFGPPTLVMGALFSHLSARASAAGFSFGRALGANTLAAAAAPIAFGVIAFPLLGPKFSLLLVAAGYLALTGSRAWRKPLAWSVAAAAVIIAAVAPRLAFIDIPEGGHVISYQEGVMAAVSVVEDADGVSRLRIDNRQQEGSSATLRVDGRQGLLPVLLHPSPHRALFLGLGTGITASSAAEEPDLQEDAVELLPEVIAASAHFTSALTGGVDNPRLHLIAADARRYVRASDEHYDVIVSDNFHPARSGSGSLYTVEHFQAVRRRLTAQGVFCQWLPLHQLDLESLRSVVQSFMVAFPNGSALLASNSLETPVIGLVGQSDDTPFDAAALARSLASNPLQQKLARMGLEDEFALLGSFFAGPHALKRFAGDAPANTDDHPVVAYRAPRITYAPDSLPRDRLIALLHELTIEPSELVASTPGEAWPARLAAYWHARNRFIESGRDVHPTADVRDMLAQVRAPLLEALHISPDFRPAYDPLIGMAMALARTDAAGARTLLTDLAQVQPARAEAGLALRELGTPAPP